MYQWGKFSNQYLLFKIQYLISNMYPRIQSLTHSRIPSFMH